MSLINNQTLLKALRDKLKIFNAESVPTQLAEKIVPVVSLDLQYKEIKIASATATDATTATLITSSTTKRTFITSASLTISKDVVSTATSSGVYCFPLGAGGAGVLAFIRYEPLTAGQFHQVITFPFPIEIEKGTIVTVINSTNVASIDTTGTVFYYEED